MVGTWQMDPEPGPEVEAVRDSRGVLWLRGSGWPELWWGDIGHTDEDGLPCDDCRQWHELLRRGPLTDATEEVEA